jgi:hypothetical protein
LRELRSLIEEKKIANFFLQDVSPGAPLRELCNVYLGVTRLSTEPILQGKNQSTLGFFTFDGICLNAQEWHSFH